MIRDGRGAVSQQPVFVWKWWKWLGEDDDNALLDYFYGELIVLTYFSRRDQRSLVARGAIVGELAVFQVGCAFW